MKDKKILNLGCGNETYGTHRVDVIKTNTTTEVFDLDSKFTFEDNYFDEVHCRSVLEHIQNLKLFISECYRVLKKGGKIFVRTDNASYLPFHVSKKHEHNEFLKSQYDYEDSHYHLFVESHMRKLFQQFKDIKIKYVIGGRNKLMKFCLKFLPFNSGAIHIELYATK